MTNTRFLIARLLFSFLGCCLLLAAPLSGLAPVYAADPPAGQDGPVNPAFEAFQLKKLQQASSPQSTGAPAEPFYGYMPHPVNLSQIKSIPVQKPILQASAVVPGSGSNAMLTGLPASFDWRPLSKVTSVKNQTTCGTCWIFGSLTAFESRVAIVDSTLNDFSEQNVAACVDPAWYYLINNKCAGGGDSFIAFDTLSRKGTRLETCDPYNVSTINSEACNAPGCTTIKEVTGFHIIANSVTTTDEINLVKNAIYNYGPVSIAFYMSESLLYTSGGYTNVYYGGTTNNANHMVSIVGWNDGIPHPSGGGYGAWIVKNSWGPTWGNSGYFYMCYGSGNVSEVGSYQVHKAYEPNEKLYAWDEVGYIYPRGWGDSSAWMANLYTANPAGSLTHVDFWTTSNNAQYQINIMDGGLSGALLATQSGACTELGYYSISLNSPVALTAGQQFAVAVKLTTPGYGYPIPVEAAYTYATPTIQPNVSYIRHLDTDTWTDLATVSRNAVLRARINSGAVTATAPIVANLSSGASNITNTTARLNGELISNGNENPTIHIYWGPTDGATTPGNWANDKNLGQTPAGTFYWDITGLTIGTRYYYRCYAANSAGSSWASSTSSFVAQVNAKVLGADSGAAAASGSGWVIMDRWPALSSSTVSEIRIHCTGSGSVKVAIYADSSGSPGTLLSAVNASTPVTGGWNTIPVTPVAMTSGTYYWLAFTSDSNIVSFQNSSGRLRRASPITYSGYSFPSSAGMPFTNYDSWYNLIAGWGSSVPTPPELPSVTNAGGATSITGTSATLNGNLTSDGNATTSVTVYWGATDGVTTASNWANHVDLGTRTAGDFSTGISGLTSGTMYYYRCSATNSVGTAWATSTSSFTAQSSGKVLGADSGAAGTSGSGWVVMDRWPALSSATVSEIRVNCTGAGNVKVAIYSDFNGSPNTLLSAVNTSTPVTAGWNSISVTPVAMTSGTNYWLAFASDSSIVSYQNSSVRQRRAGAITYSSYSFPSPASIPATNYDSWYNLLAGWGSTAPPTPPPTPTVTSPWTSVYFAWGASTGATKYTLQVNTTQAFDGTSLFNSDVTTVSQTVTGFSAGTTYYWRVRAGNDSGWSNWSAVRTIAVSQVP